jgi:hypothetical protein
MKIYINFIKFGNSTSDYEFDFTIFINQPESTIKASPDDILSE